MNILTGTARLSRDCETRFTTGGLAICSFSAAMDSGYGDSKTPVWLRMSLFGKRAEGGLPQYLKKGTQIAFSGELKVREYDDKDGVKRTSVEVSVDKLDLIGGRSDAGGQPQSSSRDQSQYSEHAPAKNNDPFADQPDFNSVPPEDDIPF